MTDSPPAPSAAATHVAALLARARAAQARIEFASQEEVDAVVARCAWACVEPGFARRLADFCAEESGMGHAPDKYAKIQAKVKGAFAQMKGRRSVGVLEDDPTRGLQRIAKPMGVVGALLPVTNSEATPCLKALFALKTRNAILLAPHPRTVRTNAMVADRFRAVLRRCGWPEDLVIAVEQVSLDISREVMRQCDLILATGGEGMVRAAYSSGTPSQGVGAGNAVSIIDETADLAEAAGLIVRSKTFDHATSCSTENALAIQDSVYAAALDALRAVGGHLVPAADKDRLRRAMWTDKGLSPAIVGQPLEKIAAHAGLAVPAGTRFLLVEEDGVGPDFPFSGEKLSVTAAVYRWRTFPEAIDLVNRITAYSGRGHSCGIHTTSEERVRELAHRVRVSRVMVRQPQCLANSGAWTNGMPMTLTLGCGSWGRNSTAGNVTWEHLLNTTWVSRPIPSTQPTDEELFGDVLREPLD